MNTAKVYQDIEGNDCTIHQMVAREPQWAAERIQEGEKAIAANVRLCSLLKRWCRDDMSADEVRALESETLRALNAQQEGSDG